MGTNVSRERETIKWNELNDGEKLRCNDQMSEQARDILTKQYFYDNFNCELKTNVTLIFNYKRDTGIYVDILVPSNVIIRRLEQLSHKNFIIISKYSYDKNTIYSMTYMNQTYRYEYIQKILYVHEHDSHTNSTVVPT